MKRDKRQLSLLAFLLLSQPWEIFISATKKGFIINMYVLKKKYLFLTKYFFNDKYNPNHRSQSISFNRKSMNQPIFSVIILAKSWWNKWRNRVKTAILDNIPFTFLFLSIYNNDLWYGWVNKQILGKIPYTYSWEWNQKGNEQTRKRKKICVLTSNDSNFTFKILSLSFVESIIHPSRLLNFFLVAWNR